MPFQWNQHRFSGGLLALDLVNTIVCRNDPQRRRDRLENLENITGFAEAAAKFRVGEIGGAVTPPRTAREIEALLSLREAINTLMRPKAQGETEPRSALPAFLAAAAVACQETGSGSLTLARAVTLSAMQLFNPQILARTKICPNCDWLFVDNSKNRSRLWCDMSVCGNRAKAKAHYQRRKLHEERKP